MKRLLLFFYLALVAGLSPVIAQTLPEVLYYKFDQGATIVNDATTPGGTNPASITGTGLSVGGVGLSATALQGTGVTSTSGVINTGWPTTINGSFTIGFWTGNIQPSSTLWYIFGDASAGSLRCFTNGVAGANNWILRGGFPDITATGAATATPNYVHFVYDAAQGELRSYINGVLNQTVVAPTNYSVTGTGFQVGGYGSSSNLNGLMDEFRWYNRALTVGEILQTINGPINPAPCTAANGGTAVSNPATICVGGTANLSATGFSFGLGTQYQWQSSADSTTWANMPNDTLPGLQVSPPATTFYRMRVICGTDTAFSVPVRLEVQGTPLAGGTYTINSGAATGGTNYASFSDFFNSVTCGGISGPVVLNVVPNSGPYNEQVLVGQIGGTSAINTITINGNGEELNFSVTNNNQRAVMTLEGSSHVIIDNLVIKALETGTYGYALQIRDGANNNIVRNCTLQSHLTSTSTLFAGVVVGSGTTPTSTNANFPFENTIEDNTILGGYYGLTIIGGGTTNVAVGNKALRNEIRDFYLYGMFSSSQEDFEYIGNDITRITRTNLSSFYGMYFNASHLGGIIAKNAIHDPFTLGRSTSVMYPFYSTSAPASITKPTRVFNNILYNLDNSGTLYGIWNATSPHWHYYHNTVYVDDPLPTAGLTYLLYLSGTADGIEMKNNLVYLRRGGTSAKYAIYVTGSGARDINNNGYFVDYTVGNTSFGFITSARATFADWQLGNGNSWDANSQFQDPNFLSASTGLLVPVGAALLNNMGTNLLSVVPTDYLDSNRTTTPDPGAFEFQIAPCSGAIGGTAAANPAQICLGGTTQVNASGFSIGIGTQYQWQVSTNNTTFTDLANDTLPSALVSPLDTSYYRLRVICGSDTAYSTSTQVNVLGTPLAGGTYTINSLTTTGGTNFQSFNDFFTTITCGGIAGPVILNVVPGTGPYNEQVLAGNIGGTSAINTLTINGNGEVLEFASSNTGQRATLTLEGSSFVTINGLVIRALSSGTHGYAIQMRDGANNNVVKNCQIEIPTTTTSSNYAGIVLGGGTTATGYAANPPFENTIDSNLIDGGYYGITMIGGAAASPAVGNKITRNTVTNFYLYGIFSAAQEDFEVVKNDLSRLTRTTLSSFYGLYFSGSAIGGVVANNAVHDPFAQVSSTSLIYAMYSTGANATAAKPTHAYNNIFYNLVNNGTLYGIWNATSSHWKYYHNTVHIDDLQPTAGLTRAFYLSGNSDGIDVFNNIFNMRRSGTSTKHIVYVLGTGTRNFNNNGYFTDYNVGTPHVGYDGSNRTTMTDWTTSSGWDLNSQFLDPQFLFAPGGLLIPATGGLDNIGQNLLTIVPTDFLDSARTITPDPGAFEFQGPPCSNPVALDTTAVTPTSVTIAWTQPGNANAWELEWGPRGFTQGTIGTPIAVGTNPYTLTGLTPGDCIDIYIRANCAGLGQGVSGWTGPLEVCLPTEYDVDVQAVLSPTRGDCGSTTLPVSAGIQNAGQLAATGFSFTATISGAVTQTLNSTYSGTLAPNATDSVFIGNISLVNGGNITVDITVNYTLDQNAANNTASFTTFINSTQPSQIQAAKDTLCPGEQVWLTTPVIPNRDNRWYDANDVEIGSGDSLQVGPITAPTFVKLAAKSGGTENVGPKDTTFGSVTNFTSYTAQSLLVTLNDEVTIVECKMYPNSGGVVEVQFRPVAPTTGPVISKTVTVAAPSSPGMPVIVPIDMTIPAGTYQMGASNASTVGGLLRNGSNANYPYGTNDFIITGSTFGAAYYYYYYDIVVSTGVPCQIDADSIMLYPNPNSAQAVFTDDVATGNGLTATGFTVNFDATGSSGTAFNWNFGDGNTGTGITTSHTYNTNGTYNVTLVVDGACGQDSVTQTITIAGIGTEDIELAQRLDVFPNPTNGLVNVSFDLESARDVYMRVLSPVGQVMFQEHYGKTAGAFRHAIDLGGFAKGVYLLQIETERGIVTRRIVVM